MAMPVLRLNFASPQGHPRTQHQLISAALEMAQWGDTRGVAAVSVDEHHVTGAGFIDEVKASYRFLTPHQLLAEAQDPDYGPIVFHPLVGGMPIDEAWRSIHLLTDEVIPHLLAGDSALA